MNRAEGRAKDFREKRIEAHLNRETNRHKEVTAKAKAAHGVRCRVDFAYFCQEKNRM